MESELPRKRLLIVTSTSRMEDLNLSSLTNMTILPTGSFVVLVLTIVRVLGCGVMPPDQARTRNFTITGFTLPLNMVYSSDATVRAKAFGIAESREAVQTFVARLTMQIVFDVLEQQGRSALLPDAIISIILGQLTVHVTYDPLECKDVEKDIQNLQMKFGMVGKDPLCIIFGNTVTSICTGNPGVDCQISMPMMYIAGIPSKHASITGTVTTTNTIMANWSREMWQNVVNRAVRLLAASPFGSHFITAFATVG